LAWEAYEQIEKSVDTMVGEQETGWDMSPTQLEEKIKKQPANIEFFEYRSVKQLKKMGLLHQPLVVPKADERVDDWLNDMKKIDVAVETSRKIQIQMNGQEYELQVNVMQASRAIHQLEAFAEKHEMSHHDKNRLFDAILKVK
jgi:hypothetical protein